MQYQVGCAWVGVARVGMGEEGGDEQLILNNIQAIQVTHVRFSLSAWIIPRVLIASLPTHI